MTDERKVALIIGGSAGIGFAAALHLAQQGCRIVIASREGPKLSSALLELRKHGGDNLAIATDVTDAQARRHLFERIDSECGRLDILINSVPGAEPASFIQHGVEHIEDGITKKLIPYLDCMKLGFERMKPRGWGRIVNVIGNMWKEPDPQCFNFGLVNAAIVNASKAASMEIAPFGVTVNGVDPGKLLTDRLKKVWAGSAEKQGVALETIEHNASLDIPTGRVGKPEEAAALIGFLVSEQASYITGQQISVDGGLMRSI